ncbi:MAG: DUF2339 domain-containing protein [Alphaproteobacteria bacterium]|nr:DUF2339 domain-containing protein [Alphaproteobacteria bacterium]
MDISKIEKRLTSIELRLSRVEGALQLSAAATPPAPAPSSTPKQPTTVLRTAAITTEQEKPGNWLGIIAVICFVLAAGFIIKLSIDSGWLTPERQIGLAALLGLSLIGSGLALLKSDREYASLLPGAGVIVLYLTAFAAHRYYKLIPFELALATTSIISALCIWLYTRVKHDAYPITAAAGAYIAPVILGLHTQGVFSVYYFLFCSLTFAVISIWLSSRMLTLVSAYMAILMTGYVGIDLNQNALIACMLALHFFIFAIGTYLYTAHNREALTEREAWAFLPVLLLFYAIEYHYIDLIQPHLAPWISLGFAGVLISLYLLARRYFKDGLGSETILAAYTTIVLFHSFYLEILPSDVRPWLFVAIMLAATFLPTSLLERKIRIPLIPAAIFMILGIEYVRMLSELWTGYSPEWLAVSFASFGSIWVVLLGACNKFNKEDVYIHPLLGAAHILAVLGLYRLTTDISSLAVSASWLFYAVAVITLAFARKDRIMAKSALFVLGFAAGKALLYDAASAPTVIRILCLLLTGAVLYGCGFMMRKVDDWKKISS